MLFPFKNYRLFISFFGCTRPSLLPVGFLELQYMSFSCRRALALGNVGFHGCGLRALEQELSPCGAGA